MGFAEDLAAWGREQGAAVTEGPGHVRMEWRVARRRSPARLKHLLYRVECEIDSPDRTCIMSETLWERNDGTLDLGAELQPRDAAYRIGTVWEKTPWGAHGNRLQQLYATEFDFNGLRHRLEKFCQREGFRLRQLIPL